MKYLFKHRNSYYFKRKIPKTQTNFLISLRTDSLNEAKFIIDTIAPRFLKLFMGNTMTWDEELNYIDSIMSEYVNEAKEDYTKYSKIREKRYSYKTKKGIRRTGSHPKAIEKAIDFLREGVYSDDRDIIYTELVKTTNIEDKCDSALKILSEDNQDRLKDELIKAEIELLFNDKKNNKNRTETPNKYIKQIEKPIVETTIISSAQKNQNLTATTPSSQNNQNLIIIETETESKNKLKYYSKTARELVELYKEEKIKDGIKEITRYIKILNIFLELTGKEYLVDLSGLELRNFCTDFSDMPNENDNNVKIELKNIKSFKKWIEITREKDLVRVSDKTTKDKLIRINAFLDYCVDIECLDRNRLTYKIKVEDSDKRKEFRIEQLETFFNTDWYNKDLEHNLEKEPHKIWIPLILLFSGARINEISQIYIKQIKEKDGVYFFKIKDAEDDQSTKNKSSNRIIPIHKILIDLGFLDYVNLQKKNNKDRLFSELYLTKSKGYGQHFGKIFNDYKKTWLEIETLEKIKERKILLDLHSFRHTFTTALRGGKVAEDDIGFILGHKKNQTQKYGSIPAKEFSNRINKANYELDFKSLQMKLDFFL